MKADRLRRFLASIFSFLSFILLFACIGIFFEKDVKLASLAPWVSLIMFLVSSIFAFWLSKTTPKALLMKAYDHWKFIGVAIAIGVVAIFVIMPFEGADYCKRYYFRLEDYPRDVVVDSTIARVRDGNYVVALLLQSKDLSLPPKTVVCEFSGKTFNLNSIQSYSGNKIKSFIETTKSYFWSE